MKIDGWYTRRGILHLVVIRKWDFESLFEVYKDHFLALSSVQSSLRFAAKTERANMKNGKCSWYSYSRVE